MKSKAARLRELISKRAVMMPGVPNASMARQVEQAGFDAVYLSGAGMINCTAGMPDIGLLNRDEVVRFASSKKLDSLVVTLKTRNFQNVAAISPARRLWI